MVRLFSPTSTSDNSTWTLVGDVDVHLCIDDAVASADDATTYVQAIDSSGTFTVEIPPISPTPASHLNHIVRIRARNAGGAAIDVGDVIVRMSSASTVVFESAKTSVPNSGWANYEFDAGLTGILPDYSTIQITIEDAGAPLDKRLRITSVELEIPSEVAVSGSTSGSSSPSASIQATGACSGTSACSSALSAALGGTGALSGSSPSSSLAAGIASGRGALAGLSAGLSTPSATGLRVVLAAGSIAGSSVPSATATGRGALSGISNGFSAVQGIVVDVSGLGPWETLSNAVRSRFDQQVAGPWKYPVVWDNAPAETFATSTWMRVGVRADGSRQIGVAAARETNLYRKSGELVVDVNVPLGIGDGGALSVADSIVSEFRDVIDGFVTYGVPVIAPGLRDGAFWRVRVTVPFFADFELARVTGAPQTGSLSYAAALGIIRDRFALYVEGPEGVEVIYDGEGDDVPDVDETWIRFTVLVGSNDVSELGASRSFRARGQAVAMVFVPIGVGEKAALGLADRMAEKFRAVTDRGVTFETPLVRSGAREGEWWRVNVTCPFTWEEIA